MQRSFVLLLTLTGLLSLSEAAAGADAARGDPLTDVPLPQARLTGAPRVKVQDLGSLGSPFAEPLYRAHLDGAGQARFLETTEELLILDSGGKLLKRRPAAGKLRGCKDSSRACSTVRAATDGRWLAEIVPVASGGGRRSTVLGAGGQIIEQVPGWVETASPDLRRWIFSQKGRLSLAEAGSKPRVLVDSGRSFQPFQACLYDESATVVSGAGYTDIIHFGKDMEQLGRHRLAANCQMVACLPRQGRSVIQCYEHVIRGGMVVPTRNNLILLDPSSTPLATLPLATLQSHYDEATAAILMSDRGGEVALLELKTGALLRHLKLNPPAGPERWALTQTLLFPGAIACMWRHDNFDRHSRPPPSPKRVMAIVDLAGREVYREAFEVTDGHMEPPMWRQGELLFVALKSKLRKLRISASKSR